VSGGLFDFYDPVLFTAGIGAADTPDTVSRCIDLVGPVPQRILDIGVGTGRVALPLLERGHTLICVDECPRMLEELLRRARAMPHISRRLCTICQPFGHRVDEQQVDVALACDDLILHYLTAGDLRSFFGSAASWIKQGGHLFMNIRSRDEAAIPRTPGPFPVMSYGIQPLDEGYCCLTYTEQFHPDTRLLVTSAKYDSLDENGASHSTVHRVLRQRLHKEEEIFAAAGSAGFTPGRLSDDGRAGRASIGGWYSFRFDRMGTAP
jgi:SAM-dependent methyltransferase